MQNYGIPFLIGLLAVCDLTQESPGTTRGFRIEHLHEEHGLRRKYRRRKMDNVKRLKCEVDVSLALSRYELCDSGTPATFLRHIEVIKIGRIWETNGDISEVQDSILMWASGSKNCR
ncbi:hypothetical protein Naga_100010g46 [Nannochloropsis gaditana]|uniref:Uncharacterized protein n=1 Tax=Nannochloropsis gaditana TaxID=72520 RepID=W7TM94_9STRA|nr:hypothetical protein Naga_100010g46 [Nannochloropsis gaditana]